MARTVEQSQLIERAERDGGLGAQLERAAAEYLDAEIALRTAKANRDMLIRKAAGRGLPHSWIAGRVGLIKSGVQKVLAP